MNKNLFVTALLTGNLFCCFAHGQLMGDVAIEELTLAYELLRSLPAESPPPPFGTGSSLLDFDGDGIDEQVFWSLVDVSDPMLPELLLRIVSGADPSRRWEIRVPVPDGVAASGSGQEGSVSFLNVGRAPRRGVLAADVPRHVIMQFKEIILISWETQSCSESGPLFPGGWEEPTHLQAFDPGGIFTDGSESGDVSALVHDFGCVVTVATGDINGDGRSDEIVTWDPVQKIVEVGVFRRAPQTSSQAGANTRSVPAALAARPDSRDGLPQIRSWASGPESYSPPLHHALPAESPSRESLGRKMEPGFQTQAVSFEETPDSLVQWVLPGRPPRTLRRRTGQDQPPLDLNRNGIPDLVVLGGPEGDQLIVVDARGAEQSESAQPHFVVPLASLEGTPQSGAAICSTGDDRPFTFTPGFLTKAGVTPTTYLFLGFRVVPPDTEGDVGPNHFSCVSFYRVGSDGVETSPRLILDTNETIAGEFRFSSVRDLRRDGAQEFIAYDSERDETIIVGFEPAPGGGVYVPSWIEGSVEWARPAEESPPSPPMSAAARAAWMAGLKGIDLPPAKGSNGTGSNPVLNQMFARSRQLRDGPQWVDWLKAVSPAGARLAYRPEDHPLPGGRDLTGDGVDELVVMRNGRIIVRDGITLAAILEFDTSLESLNGTTSPGSSSKRHSSAVVAEDDSFLLAFADTDGDDVKEVILGPNLRITRDGQSQTIASDFEILDVRDLDGDGLADIIGYNTLEDTIDVYGFREIQSLHFAQIGNGGGFTSEIVLTNPSPTLASSGTISFFDDLGQPLPIALTAEAVGAKLLTSGTAGENETVDFELEPLGSLTLVTDGQGPVVAGSARVDSDQVLGGVIRFQLPGVGVTGVGASGDSSGLVAPVRRDGTVNTGLALHNPGDQPVNLRLSLHDALGQPVPNGQRRIDDLAAFGHLAQFIGGPGEVLFPDADTENFSGTLLVEVENGRVVATALELGQQPGTFTTLPVTPRR